ncbi:ESX secretion-associated protein EspG [Nocardia sp. NPDC050175]|uniref:ESX secretion-associated protein EspG n=1 Tax=Nocardia sp. NPDC050175 TaxID=3364317 RepID=UPI0037B97FA7
MTTEWTWEPDDFAAIWYSAAVDRFPQPLHFRSRFTTAEAFEAHRVSVRERYSGDEMETIELAAHTLRTSDVRIEILGGTRKHRDNHHSMKEYRIVGARNLHYAVVLRQTATGGEDGPIRLRLCRTESLPARIAQFIPPCGPGGHEAATFHIHDIEQHDNSYIENVARNTPREQYQRLLGRPADGGGSAGLLVGSILARPAASKTISWHDITDDGRYTEQRTLEHITVRPATPPALSTLFAAWIDKAVQHLQEDGTGCSEPREWNIYE